MTRSPRLPQAQHQPKSGGLGGRPKPYNPKVPALGVVGLQTSQWNWHGFQVTMGLCFHHNPPTGSDQDHQRNRNYARGGSGKGISRETSHE